MGKTPPLDNGYANNWFLRAQDLVDKYQPDLLYFDDTGIPFEKTGLELITHFYNANAARHEGKNEAVFNTKHLELSQRSALVEDIERGVATGILPEPWQTDTCIGGWHYDRSLFEQHKYKTAGQVVRMLVDIVSKNGNLLLNVPVRGDGTIDDDEVAVLQGLAQWMTINGEAIFATRPWKVYGEGPSVTEKAEGGTFGGAKDVRSKPYTAEDIRFTIKGKTLYAIFLAWPENGSVMIHSLAQSPAGQPSLVDHAITSVSLLGSTEKLVWSQDATGVRVSLPATKPGAEAYALRIEL